MRTHITWAHTLLWGYQYCVPYGTVFIQRSEGHLKYQSSFWSLYETDSLVYCWYIKLVGSKLLGILPSLHGTSGITDIGYSAWLLFIKPSSHSPPFWDSIFCIWDWLQTHYGRGWPWTSECMGHHAWLIGCQGWDPSFQSARQALCSLSCIPGIILNLLGHWE